MSTLLWAMRRGRYRRARALSIHRCRSLARHARGSSNQLRPPPVASRRGSAYIEPRLPNWPDAALPMIILLYVIHVLIAVALVGVVMLQKSEGGALGMEIGRAHV